MVISVDYSLLPKDSNVLINANQGAYTNGCAYPIEKKLSVASLYDSRCRTAGLDRRPTLSSVAKEAGVSVGFVAKVLDELNTFGTVVESKSKYSGPRGIGSKSLTLEDQWVLLELLERNPFRTRRNYVYRLRQITGTCVSESTISQFFLRGFPIRGSLRKPDLVPKDKFKPENVARYFEYVDFASQVDPKRLKFGDEKLLKGAEVYCRKGRRNVLTGDTPEFMVNGDFRNTYSIIGFCGINKKSPPLSFTIHDEKNDATSFSESIMSAIAEGFLRRHDILVLDNAAIHDKGENDGIEDWLWENHGVAVVFLPTRSPELNPIELVWRSLVMKLRSSTIVDGKSHGCAIAATEILGTMSHKSIRATYRECKYIK